LKIKKIRISAKHALSIVTIIMMIIILITLPNRKQVTFMEQGLGYVVVPAQQFLGNIQNWMNEKLFFIFHTAQIQEDNKKMLEEIDQLRYENTILKQYQKDNERLRVLLELDQKYAQYPKVGAQVIGKDPGNWYDVFLINKGSNHGLKVDMVVLAGSGLVGRIIEVGANYSKVLSIIDDTSSVSAQVLRTDEVGNVRGDKTLMNEGLCRVQYVNIEAQMIPGDELVTSHLGDIYPPGILIGTIQEVKTESHGLTKYALLEPVVDFKHLEEVLVIDQVWKEKKPNLKEFTQ